MRVSGCPQSDRSDSDLSAFAQAVQANRSTLLRLARRITANADDAEDVVQDAFLKAFANLHQFRGEARLNTWLRAIVVNTAANLLRARRRSMLLPLEPPCKEQYPGKIAWEVPDSRRSPYEECELTELEDRILAAIEHLPPSQRAVIQICVLEDHSYVDAARALNTRVVTVKARLFRGRGTLKAMLK